MAKTVLILTLFILMGCNEGQATPKVVKERSPEQVYVEFKAACDTADIATAESYVMPDAIEEKREHGVCILMPDGVNQIFEREAVILKSHTPKVEISGNTAYLTWVNENGPDMQMIMYKNNNSWKIRRSLVLLN